MSICCLVGLVGSSRSSAYRDLAGRGEAAVRKQAAYLFDRGTRFHPRFLPEDGRSGANHHRRDHAGRNAFRDGKEARAACGRSFPGCELSPMVCWRASNDGRASAGLGGASRGDTRHARYRDTGWLCAAGYLIGGISREGFKSRISACAAVLPHRA